MSSKDEAPASDLCLEEDALSDRIGSQKKKYCALHTRRAKPDRDKLVQRRGTSGKATLVFPL